MAKNLKITVKNAQLAEALKKLKKPDDAATPDAPPKPPKKAKQEQLPPAPEAPPVEKKVEPVAPPSPPVEAAAPPKEPEARQEPRPEARQEPRREPRQEPRMLPNFKPSPFHNRDQRSNYSQQRPYPPRPYSPRPGAPRSGPPQHGSGYQRPAGGPPGSSYPRENTGFRRPTPGAPSRYRQPTPGAPSGGGYRPGGAPRPPYGGPPRPGFRPGMARPAFQPKPDLRAASRAPQKPLSEEESRKANFKDQKGVKKTDLARSFDSRDKRGLRSGEDEVWRPRKGRKSRMSLPGQEEMIIRPKNLSIRLPITIKDLASEMKLKASQLISNLFMKGVVITLNDYVDDETTVQLLGHDFDCEITIDTSEEKRIQITDKTIKQEIQETPADQLVLRAPVVTFMGHVDHGKTSLIDTIRKSDVASGEAGAITQHIGAFRCHTAAGDIAILDTPGHEAFSAMRARGADVTDIVVLVVAGDEGLRAQTNEAVEQARAASVPIVVAINKSDKPNFNAENVYRQLSEINLLPEAWGGQIITVNCSAVTGEGVKELLEMLALQAEILELKANPHARARGAVIESEMHKGLGAVTTVLVQNGTLRLGDAVVFAEHWGRIKTMHDEHNKTLTEAGPSTPVKITGLSGLPEAGSDFIVVANEKEAASVSEERARQKKHTALQTKRSGLENLLQQTIQKQEKKVLTLMLRADVQGSLEALKHSLEKIESSKAEINIVSASVGEISESDIALAAASKATIIGFHTQVESHAESMIKQLKVQVRLHDIIYHAVDDVKELMVALLDKIAQEHDVGEAEVKALFKSSQLGIIAGCQVVEGTIKRSSQMRVVRDKEVIWKGTIHSLKRVKEDVREVSKGQECGILLQGFTGYKEGDLLQAYDVTYLTQEL